MIVFKSKIYSNKDKVFNERSLKQRLLTPYKSPIYIFPICLFSKSFYHDLKQSNEGLFSGEIIDGQFELSRTSKIFSTRTWLPVMAKGNIEDNEMAIKYLIPNYVLFSILFLILIDLVFITKTNEFDNILFFVTVITLFAYILKIIWLQYIFKRIWN